MALRINTNIAAINSHRQLLVSEKAMASSMEKLSSGYRINRASDDAAGLSIANRLRTNVRSLTVASRNITEGKAMVSIAEGAGNQLEGIMERLKELATQAASDNAGADRGKIASEATKLVEEIDRIVNATTYQGTSLLKGSFGNTLSSINGSTVAGTLTTAAVSVSGASAGTYMVTITGTLATITDSLGNRQGVTVFSTGAQTLDFDQLGISIRLDGVTDTVTDLSTGQTITVTAGACGGMFQVGSGATVATDTIGVSLGDLRSTALHLNNLSLTSAADARTAMNTIDSAIDSVGSVLGDIGAAMNRFDYAYSNITVSIENFQASQSAIRDVDMAAEMVNFTKNQILTQAGTAMLAQANTSSQNVLSLMR